MKTGYSYKAEIDGLRAFSVLSVVAFHAFPTWLNGGFIGVDVFFVISGFLITSHIFENLDNDKFSFVDFFSRRIRRIFPALILVMACSLAFGWFTLLADEFSQLGKYIASAAIFITNLILVNESGYFDNAAETKPMLHLWSLAVEEQFYIVWPLMLWLAWKRNLNLLTITIVVASVSFYINLKFVKSNPIETFFWPFGRFWELLSGSILAWLLLYKSDILTKFKIWLDELFFRIIFSKNVKADGSTTSNLMAFLGLLLLAYGVIHISENISFPSKWALIPVLGASLVIASGSKAWVNRIFLMNPIAVWFGLISYPLYLWHWPVISFFKITSSDSENKLAMIWLVLFSISLAWLTYKFIEQPIRFGLFRNKINSSAIIIVLFMVGGLGYYIGQSNWENSNAYEDLLIKRRGGEHAFGASLKWYQGKDDWLFLGNHYDRTVAKRRLAATPSNQYIGNVYAKFSKLASKGTQTNTKIALLIGPNKSSVYMEYLPETMNPSTRRYSTLITGPLENIENLTIADPTDHLIDHKTKKEILYWRTDTHWNQKGAYLSFIYLMKKLGLRYPKVEFTQEGTRRGDLISISKKENYPINTGDNWSYNILEETQIDRQQIHNEEKTAFGWQGRVNNKKALNEMTIWVVGDSFTGGVRPFIEASFSDITYIGHWAKELDNLAAKIDQATKKPDLILIVRVERSF